MEQNRYNHTKIYKLIDCINHNFYIGSTCDILSKRLSWHKDCSKQNPERKVYKYFNSIGWEKVKIILIEEHVLENREQQLREEDRILTNFLNDPKCLNSLRAFTGLDKDTYNKERYEANKQELLDKQKQYYEHNKDTILQYQKDYNEKNKEKILERQHMYSQCHADKYRVNSKRHYMMNKDKLLEKQECGCGSTYVFMGENRHEKNINSG